MPVDGVAKPPRPSEEELRNNRIVKAGQQVGIDFTYKCDRYPYTLFAHAMLEYVREKHGSEKQNELAEVVFKAYFTDGLYPDVDTLAALGDQAGLGKEEVKAVMMDENNVKRVEAKARQWSKKGVSGVPCFVINGVEAGSGAQDPNALSQLFKMVAEKFPLQS